MAGTVNHGYRTSDHSLVAPEWRTVDVGCEPVNEKKL